MEEQPRAAAGRETVMERYVHTIWCDDIRQEIGNKPSFMGVYTNAMVLPGVPVVLPRLAAWTWLSVPLTDRQPESINYRVLRSDGQVVAEFDAPLQSSGSVNDVDVEKTRRNYLNAVGMVNLEVPEGTKFFQVVMEVDGEKIESNKLWIQVNPELIASLQAQVPKPE